MEKSNWYMKAAAGLLVLSGVIYLVHYAVFRDPHHIFIYMVGDFAFLPLEVLIVSLIIDRLLKAREKRLISEKMKMVESAFYSEVGSSLLRRLLLFDPSPDEKTGLFENVAAWEPGEFQAVKSRLSEMDFKADASLSDISDLNTFLKSKRDFLLSLLENPYLMEQEALSDILWAVFHLTDELEAREKIPNLPLSDLNHLSNDLSRVYSLTVSHWLDYMAHLEAKYPYLFSLAARLNPFKPDASALILD